MDGGVRSGTDVVKAVALGAKAVMIGRPWVWALAARGEQGVTDLLAVMQKEMATAMGLMGVNSISEIKRELIDP
jgi:L-lactate dehydrogenase (cytochrome)